MAVRGAEARPAASVVAASHREKQTVANALDHRGRAVQ